LQNSGYIKGYSATLELKGDVKTCTFVVEITLQEHGAGMFRRFESEICKRPELVECLHTAGGINYIVKFVTPGIEQFQTMLEELLEADIGIAKYASYIVTKVVKENKGIPLKYLLQDKLTQDNGK
jgi:Lrp/AsnC family transcriptional regulator of ectoine degradation